MRFSEMLGTLLLKEIPTDRERFDMVTAAQLLEAEAFDGSELANKIKISGFEFGRLVAFAGRRAIKFDKDGMSITAGTNTETQRFIKFVQVDGTRFLEIFAVEDTNPDGEYSVVRGLGPTNVEHTMEIAVQLGALQTWQAVLLTTMSVSEFTGTWDTPSAVLIAEDATVFNEHKRDRDHIFRGDTLADLLKIDAGLEQVEVNGFMNWGPATELTIASGAITATGTYHVVDTQSDASSDNLDTINGGEQEGNIVVISTADNGRDVVVTEDGNCLVSGSTTTLATTAETWMARYDAGRSKWCEIAHGSP